MEGAKAFEIVLDENKIMQFNLYIELLREWNERINLTSVLDEKEIVIKHFIDSLSILPYIRNDSNVIDIGTGAGFPLIPLKIAQAGLDVTLVDSVDKKVKFLKLLTDSLKLDRVQCIHSRAEDLGNNQKYRGQYEVATARAVAPLNVLLEYCMPFLKPRGIFIAMKAHCDEEISQSARALEILGGKIEKIQEFNLAGEFKRTIIIVKKHRQTPTNYPRKSGKPTKNPLI